MDPGNLTTHGQYDFHGGVDVLCTAHYKLDPSTGDMLFFAATGPIITWYRAEAGTGKIVDSHTFEVGIPVMLHDFVVTTNYAIFFVAPMLFRLDLIQQGLPGHLGRVRPPAWDTDRHDGSADPRGEMVQGERRVRSHSLLQRVRARR